MPACLLFARLLETQQHGPVALSLSPSMLSRTDQLLMWAHATFSAVLLYALAASRREGPHSGSCMTVSYNRFNSKVAGTLGATGKKYRDPDLRQGSGTIRDIEPRAYLLCP
jgi:hypothetical protein